MNRLTDRQIKIDKHLLDQLTDEQSINIKHLLMLIYIYRKSTNLFNQHKCSLASLELIRIYPPPVL